MPFDIKVVRQAWSRCAGRCECTRAEHNHPFGRCNLKLRYDRRGQAKKDAWEIRRKDPSRGEIFPNSEIVCMECFIKISES